jgi:hypothetical protein
MQIKILIQFDFYSYTQTSTFSGKYGRHWKSSGAA